jgi:hypothetical protein
MIQSSFYISLLLDHKLNVRNKEMSVDTGTYYRSPFPLSSRPAQQETRNKPVKKEKVSD